MMTEIKASVNPDPIFRDLNIFLGFYRPFTFCWYVGRRIFVHVALIDNVRDDMNWLFEESAVPCESN